VAAVSPDGFTETLTKPGVRPKAGLTDSHEPPDAVAVKLFPDVPPTVMDCVAGA
jgi:hypothetical protein